ncbi:MAG: hypothetical protein ILO53_06985 [Clostridia bacterium]|nr:hypothetical protein [Clostridia bacterium]
MSGEALYLARDNDGRLVVMTGGAGGLRSRLTSDVTGFAGEGNSTIMEPAPTEAPKTAPRKSFDIRPFIIVGVVLGLALAVFLAIRKANKKFGKGFE